MMASRGIFRPQRHTIIDFTNFCLCLFSIIQNFFVYILILYSFHRYDGCSRNVFRHEDLKDCVELSKIRDHFIFNVESVGALLPEDIVTMALDVLEEKCQVFIDILEQK